MASRERFPRTLFQWAFVAQAVVLLGQALLAGAALAGSAPSLGSHAALGGVALLWATAQVGLGVTLLAGVARTVRACCSKYRVPGGGRRPDGRWPGRPLRLASTARHRSVRRSCRAFDLEMGARQSRLVASPPTPSILARYREDLPTLVRWSGSTHWSSGPDRGKPAVGHDFQPGCHTSGLWIVMGGNRRE